MDTAWTRSWSHRIGTDPVLVHPDGCMDLVFDDGTVWVAGADTGPRYTTHREGDFVEGVRFAPGLLPAVLGVPANEFTDLTAPLADVSPALARRLRTHQDISAVFISDALESATLESWVEPTVRALFRGVSAAQIAHRLEISQRQLHRRCVAAFGYGPRRLQVILRADRAIDLLRAGHDLSETAATAGYADYPHLYRDVLRLTGLRPAAFSRR